MRPGSARVITPISTPCALHCATTRLASASETGVFAARSLTSSTPCSKPLPRTSPMTACLSASWRRHACK
ncbi:Uncharacterised protein [Bordetella pertussis]|nr:Uncharacterised protein [Bordetella pertussis]